MFLETNAVYDVCIVGAGPGGSTCAYYLAQQGKRVLLLEKEKFPRDKVCGDAICTRAQAHLQKMGILQDILVEGKGKWAEIGGFFSPNGIRFIGNSAEYNPSPLVIAIKRIILDEKIADAAVKAGATLAENSPVNKAEFSQETQLWTIHCKTKTNSCYKAKVLIAADGANSQLARSIGIVTTHPDSVCSRTYIKPGTSDFTADGVVFYPSALLPGYCALFRQAGDELSFCCYIIPGGSCQKSDLGKIYRTIIEQDPYVSQAIGPNAQMERMKAAPLRLGGIPKSYSNHFLIVGDAAGQIDPLTGEGIQYAMDAAEIAAETLAEAFAANNFSERFLKRYQERWMKSFGLDFYWSRKIADFYTKYPIFLDACAELTRQRGSEFLAEWAKVMTGSQPKSYFLQPQIALPMVFEVGRQWLKQKIA